MALAAVAVLAGALASDAAAQRRDRDRDEDRRGRGLELLGEQRVGFRVDRDVIRVNQSEEWYRSRRYRTLHFVADGNDVHMISLRLVYLNGYAEEFRVDRLIRDGEEMPVDLRGERSYIRDIEMVYRSRPDFRGQATIRVYGEPARRFGPGPDREWVELGCQQVSLIGKDRDTIRVGLREGRFRAIRLAVRGADVELLDLNVVYGNGERHDIAVKHFLREGERTRPLDLRGRDRHIDRVELLYRSRINPADIVARQKLSVATVCVEGLQ